MDQNKNSRTVDKTVYRGFYNLKPARCQMGQEASRWTNLLDTTTMDLESIELTRDSAEVV